MVTIIVKVESIPNNHKNTSIICTLNNDKYKIVRGRRYLYMIDYSNNAGYKVLQTITLLNQFSFTMSNVTKHAEQLINTIKQTSYEQMKQSNLNKIK